MWNWFSKNWVSVTIATVIICFTILVATATDDAELVDYCLVQTGDGKWESFCKKTDILLLDWNKSAEEYENYIEQLEKEVERLGGEIEKGNSYIEKAQASASVAVTSANKDIDKVNAQYKHLEESYNKCLSYNDGWQEKYTKAVEYFADVMNQFADTSVNTSYEGSVVRSIQDVIPEEPTPSYPQDLIDMNREIARRTSVVWAKAACASLKNFVTSGDLNSYGSVCEMYK